MKKPELTIDKCGRKDAFMGPCILRKGHNGFHHDGCYCDVFLNPPVYLKECPKHAKDGKIS